MRNVVQLCLAANNTLPMRSCDRSWVKKGRSLHFPKIFIKKQTWSSNDKTFIPLVMVFLIPLICLPYNVLVNVRSISNLIIFF